MKSVLVMMSTFNGERCLMRQLNSIFAQEGVIVNLLVRDDGSTDRTLEILKSFQNKYPRQIQLIFGENKGYKQSFLDLLSTAKRFDYYAFSDQDDFWYSKKLFKSIQFAEKIAKQLPILVQCGCDSTDEFLNVRKQKEYLFPVDQSNIKTLISTEHFRGCGMLWNYDLQQILYNKRPKDPNISHDYWVGLIGSLFGKVVYTDEHLFAHIRYEKNQSTDGNRLNGRRERLRLLRKSNSAYMNPSSDLINIYGNYFSKKQFCFLYKCSHYKSNFRFKLSLLFDFGFKRPSLLSTICFKMAILTNKF
jgi:glycosyltransferase involved in cell wall biosynthesis